MLPSSSISPKSIPTIRRRRKRVVMSRKTKKSPSSVSNREFRLTIFCVFLFVVYIVYSTIPTANDKNATSTLSLRGNGMTSDTTYTSTGGATDADIWVKPNAQNFNDQNIVKEARHLIMVAGHSVIVGGHLKDADMDEKDWYLLDYQKGHGLPQAIVGHIREGIKLASFDPKSLLIFSGGETRSATGPINEGSSYFHVADAMELWDENVDKSNSASTVRARTITEEFATDSFQNLLFSICRFKEVTGDYPTKITVVSYSFKKRRFEQLHATALRWPNDNFTYVGIDPQASTGFDLSASSEGEKHNAAVPFESDPYGCHTKVLQDKRQMRNPFSRTPPYELSCPEMKELLKWCGPELISIDQVPWSS